MVSDGNSMEWCDVLCLFPRCTGSLQLTHITGLSDCLFFFCFPESSLLISTPLSRNSLRTDLACHVSLAAEVKRNFS